MEEKIVEIAERIKGMRDVLDISSEEMAQTFGIPVDEYLEYEKGSRDFTFTFLYKAANKFGIDMTELMTGSSPRLKEYSIVRKGEGLPIERRKGFKYESVAHRFKGRNAEVFIVDAAYDETSQNKEIALNSHEGQEFDYILEGKLKIKIEKHEEILNEGDTIYYNAKKKHGMISLDKNCKFMAVIIKDRYSEGENA